RNDGRSTGVSGCRLCETAKPGNTGQVLPRAQAFGVTYGRCDHRVELIKPLRQLTIEKTAQLDRAEAAGEKHVVSRLRLRQREIARDGAGANKSIHGFLR